MDTKNRIINACGFSNEMKEYLKTQELSNYELTCIIAGSLLKLEEKLELYPLIDDDYAAEFYEETKNALDALKLKHGEIINMTHCWYDPYRFDEEESLLASFTSFEAALEYLQELIKTEELDKATNVWMLFDILAPTEEGKMKHKYTYYLINDKIVYFVYGELKERFRGYVSSMSLNLPTPFEVGDIVVLNCQPFASVRVALLTEAKNGDSCGVWMLYRDTDGEWKTGALKHGHGWNHHYPLLSPLYRLEKLEFSEKKIPEILKDEKFTTDEKELYLLKDLQNSLRKIARQVCPEKNSSLRL